MERMSVRCIRARKKPAIPGWRGWRAGCGGSGDDRLSRQGHYHGPGGLNGRVRDGNGWGPASIVAGIRPGGGQAAPAGGGSEGRSRELERVVAGGGGGLRSSRTRPGRARWGRPMDLRTVRSRPAVGMTGGGGSGWSSGRLLGPVGCDGRPSCTPGLSTWSSSRSLRR